MQEGNVILSKELRDLLGNRFDGSVPTVYYMIMAGGNNKPQRMLAAAGKNQLSRHEEFIRNLINTGKKYEGLKELHNMILQALSLEKNDVPSGPAELLRKYPTNSSMRISRRESVTVTHRNWTMTYLPDGWYRISKNGKEIASGKYDAVIADSYNNQMSKDDREENLTRDLISWVEKAIKGKVTD
jgi:hypothetical protein